MCPGRGCIPCRSRSRARPRIGRSPRRCARFGLTLRAGAWRDWRDVARQPERRVEPRRGRPRGHDRVASQDPRHHQPKQQRHARRPGKAQPRPATRPRLQRRHPWRRGRAGPGRWRVVRGRPLRLVGRVRIQRHRRGKVGPDRHGHPLVSAPGAARQAAWRDELVGHLVRRCARRAGDAHGTRYTPETTGSWQARAHGKVSQRGRACNPKPSGLPAAPPLRTLGRDPRSMNRP